MGILLSIESFYLKTMELFLIELKFMNFLFESIFKETDLLLFLLNNFLLFNFNKIVKVLFLFQLLL